MLLFLKNICKYSRTRSWIFGVCSIDFSVLPCFRIGRSSLVSRKTFWLGPSPQMDRTWKRWRRLHTNSYHVFTSLSLSIPVRINDNNFRFNFVQILLFFLKVFVQIIISVLITGVREKVEAVKSYYAHLIIRQNQFLDNFRKALNAKFSENKVRLYKKNYFLLLSLIWTENFELKKVNLSW